MDDKAAACYRRRMDEMKRRWPTLGALADQPLTEALAIRPEKGATLKSVARKEYSSQTDFESSLLASCDCPIACERAVRQILGDED